MKPVLFLCYLVSFTITYGFALKCWLCIGSLESDCFLGNERAMVVQECGAALRNASTAKSPLRLNEEDSDVNPEVIVTSCVSFIAEQYGSQMIERGCAYTYENLDVCDYISELEDVWVCDSCVEDKCNFRNIVPTVNVRIISDD